MTEKTVKAAAKPAETRTAEEPEPVEPQRDEQREPEQPPTAEPERDSHDDIVRRVARLEQILL